jgi:hypothetical protein
MFSTRLYFYNSETVKKIGSQIMSWRIVYRRERMLVGNMRSEKYEKLKNLILFETGYRKLLIFYTNGEHDTPSV